MSKVFHIGECFRLTTSESKSSLAHNDYSITNLTSQHTNQQKSPISCHYVNLRPLPYTQLKLCPSYFSLVSRLARIHNAQSSMVSETGSAYE